MFITSTPITNLRLLQSNFKIPASKIITYFYHLYDNEYSPLQVSLKIDKILRYTYEILQLKHNTGFFK